MLNKVLVTGLQASWNLNLLTNFNGEKAAVVELCKYAGNTEILCIRESKISSLVVLFSDQPEKPLNVKPLRVSFSPYSITNGTIFSLCYFDRDMSRLQLTNLPPSLFAKTAALRDL